MLFLSFKHQILEAAQSADSEAFLELIRVNSSFSYNLTKVYNKNGDTVVHLAALCGSVDIIKHCSFQINAGMLTQINYDGKTPLHVAAQSSKLQCVEFLLSCNVPVDPLKRSDWTPLMLACTKSNLDVVKTLLTYGANPTLQNKDGWTSLHIASRENSVDIIKHLLDLNLLLWKTQSKNGRTPLHTAALHGNKEVVELFLSETNHEKDPVDSCGTTPLMDAVSGSHNEVVKILIKSGASFRTRDRLGRNVLHLSAQAGNVDGLLFLIQECEIDINSTTNDGLTALHFAAKGKHLLCVKVLLELGADCTIQDNKGRTAMIYSPEEKISSIFRDTVVIK